MINDQITHFIISRADAKAQGKPTFYTGEPCKAGHLTTRATSNGMCMECKRLYMQDYDRQRRERNPSAFRASVNESVKRHYQRNKAAILTKKREYYQRNADAIRERAKARRAAAKAAAERETPCNGTNE
jgi:phosphoenolpyruvate carboxylase